MIKRLTKFITYFCGAVVLAGSLTIYTIQSFSADDNCGSITIAAKDGIFAFSVNDEFKFTITDQTGMATASSYTYTAWAKDLTTGKDSIKGGGTVTGSRTDSVYFNTKGQKELYIIYSKKDSSSCINIKSNIIGLNIIDNTSSSANIDMSVSDSKALVGAKISVMTTVTSAKDNTVQLSVDDSIKWAEPIVSSVDTFRKDYSWDTSGSSVGTHTIKVKVFGSRDSDGTSPMIDMKEYSVMLCPGSDITTCDDPGSDSDGTGSSVNLPDKTGDLDIGGQIMNFTLNRGSGVAGLVSFIINLLLELTGAAAFIAILVAGVKYITASGDAAKADKAKKAILYAVIAMFLAIFSLSIVHMVNNLVK